MFPGAVTGENGEWQKRNGDIGVHTFETIQLYRVRKKVTRQVECNPPVQVADIIMTLDYS